MPVNTCHTGNNNNYNLLSQRKYKNQEVIRLNKGFATDVPTQRGNYQIPPRPRTQQKAEFSSPYIHRTNKFVDVNARPAQKSYESPKTNMRFLESVTKIYERSGRADLADGLKNSITKAKQTI